MAWTTQQQQAIDSRDKNLLVAAAAGSEKTAVLVERITKLALEEKISEEDKFDVDKMLVVTFTNEEIFHKSKKSKLLFMIKLFFISGKNILSCACSLKIKKSRQKPRKNFCNYFLNFKVNVVGERRVAIILKFIFFEINF